MACQAVGGGEDRAIGVGASVGDGDLLAGRKGDRAADVVGEEGEGHVVRGGLVGGDERVNRGGRVGVAVKSERGGVGDVILGHDVGLDALGAGEADRLEDVVVLGVGGVRERDGVDALARYGVRGPKGNAVYVVAHRWLVGGHVGDHKEIDFAVDRRRAGEGRPRRAGVRLVEAVHDGDAATGVSHAGGVGILVKAIGRDLDAGLDADSLSGGGGAGDDADGDRLAEAEFSRRDDIGGRGGEPSGLGLGVGLANERCIVGGERPLDGAVPRGREGRRGDVTHDGDVTVRVGGDIDVAGAGDADLGENGHVRAGGGRRRKRAVADAGDGVDGVRVEGDGDDRRGLGDRRELRRVGGVSGGRNNRWRPGVVEFEGVFGGLGLGRRRAGIDRGLVVRDCVGV